MRPSPTPDDHLHPPPAGTYSVSSHAGGLIFLAGQTPRDPSGKRHGDAPFAVQARLAMNNLEAARDIFAIKNAIFAL